MLTPKKIQELVKDVSNKHTQATYGLYPPQKKIMDFITRQIGYIAGNKDPDISKVKEMTNLLEGLVRYLNNTNIVLKLDIDKILTYIYYPETEKTTLDNKDNLLIGSKGETVRLWHDAYSMTNRKQILNCLIECKNVLSNRVGNSEFIQAEDSGMPVQMEIKYREMLTSR
jgi:hypothetical protein